MKSIIETIYKLRGGTPINYDDTNRNRYEVIAKESDGSRTAYCFSAPIYNVASGKLVDLSFKEESGMYIALGSSSKITVRDEVFLENNEGTCHVKFPGEQLRLRGAEVSNERVSISPTINGIVCTAKCLPGEKFSFSLVSGIPFLNARKNDKYFALMSSKHRPYVSVSGIGTVDNNGQVVAPVSVFSSKVDDRTVLIDIISKGKTGTDIVFEINQYEEKLFQDTTVESANPQSNNAFGGIAFIGSTSTYGEQWLYSRPNLALINNLFGTPISKAVLHIPILNNLEVDLNAYFVKSRFCSFGSNWDNKVSSSTLLGNACYNNDYRSLDITSMLCDPQYNYISATEGFILRAKTRHSGFSVLSTGDCYHFPQILEIRYK